MSFLRQLGKVVARAVTVPVSVVSDVVTMGGVLTEDNEVATFEHLKKLRDDIKDLPDSMEEDE